MTAPLTPTDLIPVHLSTVTTSDFLVACTLRPWPNRQRAEFQFATDAGFTTNVHTAQTPFRNPGAVSTNAGTPRLPQGDVYVRVRAIDQLTGDPSPWSQASKVNVEHPGTALPLFPAAGESLPWEGGSVTFQWEFRDTSGLDSQTAYRLRVQSNDADNTYATVKSVYGSYGSIFALNDNYADLSSSGGAATLYDSGKIAGTAQSRTVTLPSQARNEIIRWTIETWDDDDKSAGPTPPTTFFVGDHPTVTITAPTTIATSPAPTITWNYSSAAGHAQERYRVRFIEVASGQMIFDSGTQSGATTSYIPPSQVLKNGEDVLIVVDVFSTAGVKATDVVQVTPQWIAPPNPSIEVLSTHYADAGRVDIEWHGAPKAATFIEWRVYRRADDGYDWEYLGATDDYYFLDYSAPSMPNVQYSVTQVGMAFGVQVESPLIPVSVDLTVTNYLLMVKDDPGISVPLYVVGDEFTPEYEEEAMEVIGVGRKVEVGTTWGRKGTLTVHFRDMGIEGQAGENLRKLMEVKEAKRACYLRIPFKQTLEVHISNIQIARIPGVASELSDITLEYTEIK